MQMRIFDWNICHSKKYEYLFYVCYLDYFAKYFLLRLE